ncbi:hypothetical protein C5F48_13510 [Cereibacter changlensis JA139]|uniref:Outer membrane protein assembly factor BamE n=2 Tax=Cereibacter changlensis TaxID=402884 RepID=A0A2T4JTG3_9RHOB|nr:hypothetical protein [Cereibacter changlensis]PTE21202.1 hypothetical protein C5F48_13510 [Cereibacter changlensis JA139]PZX56420.1 hypothetical protein LX76_01449 [Cereibacter changlensis]
MMKRFGAGSALGALALLVILPLGPAAAQERDPLNEVNPRVGFTSVTRSYPSMDARYVRVGIPREIAQVRRVALGQSPEEVQAVLGRPAVGYGDGSWEYHLSLPLTRSDRLICQYRAFFDGADKLVRGVWRRPQCADLVLGRAN